MTVCDMCGQIDMNTINDFCRQCEADIEELEEEEREPCDECGSKFHSTFRCDFDEYEA